ncbi:MAG: efflux RND transporter periplasmic adaptor subunit [Planctomycetes bacterium]|nr:efflux RND transporter periplasmic adaptor subunit [Planctomycetota bacterium]
MATAIHSDLQQESPPVESRRHGIWQHALTPGGVIGTAAGLALFIGLALWIRAGFNSGFESPDDLTYEVKRGDLTISFTERGNVRALKSAQVISQLQGMSSIVSVVPEGTFVKEGDLLVELDSSELTQYLNQQEIQVESAYAAQVQAHEEMEIQKSQMQSDLNAARLDLELAELDLKKYEEGDWLIALEKAKADIYIASEELERARNKFEWTKKLADRGYVTGTELIADELAMKKFEVQKRQAEGNLKVLENYTHQKDLKQYRSKMEQAKMALDRTNRKANATLAKAEADLKAKEKTYVLSQNRLNKLKDQLAKTKIFASQDGMVVYHDERWGRDDKLVEQGAQVRENQHLIDLPDISTMAVNVQVHESRIDQVEIGTPAFVSIDAYPNLNLRGKVTKIGLLPDNVNRWLNPDLKVYRTEITLDDSEAVKLLRPGMSAMVELVTAKLSNVVYVPVQSVTTIDGVQHCLVYEDGKFGPRKVTGGLYNEAFIEIKEGLQEGEVIQLNAPSPEGARNPAAEISENEIPALTKDSLDEKVRSRKEKERKERGNEDRGDGPPVAEGQPRGRGIALENESAPQPASFRPAGRPGADPESRPKSPPQEKRGGGPERLKPAGEAKVDKAS